MSVVRSYIRTSFRVAENEWCEHTSGDFKINIKTRAPQLHRKLPGTLIKFMYCMEENALSKVKKTRNDSGVSTVENYALLNRAEKLILAR